MLENAEHDDCGNLADNNGNTANNEEVECLNSPCTPVRDTNAFENQSKWLLLLDNSSHLLCTILNLSCLSAGVL